MNKIILEKKTTENGEIKTNINDMADEFNRYFIETSTKMASRISQQNDPIDRKNNRREKSIFMKPVTKNEILENTHSLKTVGAPGKDGIATKTFKTIHPYILDPLQYLFNRAIETGAVPAVFKYCGTNFQRWNTNRHRKLSANLSYN